jgi:phosphoribosylformylglycinamidine cyclo-ligase
MPVGLNYDRSTWSLPVATQFLADVAAVPQTDMKRSWNCGIGMSAFVDPAIGDLVFAHLQHVKSNLDFWSCRVFQCYI